MREENKQTNNKQKLQEKNSFNKKILTFLKKILIYRNTATILSLIAICIISILTLTSNSFAAFTVQEMEEFQGNNIISGMCYVYKIMNSNLTKALGAAFVIGTGWLFFFGGIKSWHYVLSLSVGVTLIFGGVELANIISRNDYTCNKVIEDSKEDESAGIEGSTKTTYTIREIDAYYPGQEWKICDKDIVNLNLANCESIDENDEISIDDDRDLVLFKCQPNYARLLDNVYLKYRYNKADKSSGSFILVNSMNTSSTGADSILEQLKCKPSCKLSKLNELLEIYQAETNKTDKGEIIILNDSGKLKEGKYATMGTQIDLNCLNGLEEHDENDRLNESGLIAICNNNGEFEIKGSCKGKCDLNNYKDKKVFTEWQKYDTKTKTWVDSKDDIFLYGDKIRIKTCNEEEGYAFETNLTSSGENILSDNDKLVIVCSSIGNSNVWVPKAGGKSCSKFCKLNNYIHYSENIWRKNCNILDGCTEDLRNGENLFKVGSKLGVVDCIDKSIYNLDITKKTLTITCNDSKEWEEDDGTRCFKKCNPNEIEFYDYADDWNLCIKGECSVVKFEKIGELKNGDTIQQLTCKRGYDFNDREKSTIFSCNDGKFDRLNNYYDEICMPKCYLKFLGDFDNSSYTWIETDNSGNTLTPENKIKPEEINEKEKSSYAHYFTLNECKEGYEKVDYTTESNTEINNKNTITYCDEYDTWQIIKQEVKCNIKKCQFDLNTIKTNIGEENYNKLGLGYSSQWTEIKDDKITNYTIMTSNPNYKFDYGTIITLNSCINDSNGTYLFGSEDTTLTCNANGEWQLLTSATDSTAKRCKTGMCKNGPTSLIENSTIISANNTDDNIFNADGSQATFNKDNLNNVYYGNNLTLNLNCTSGYYEVDNNGNVNTNGSYYKCENGSWKTYGNCTAGCNEASPVFDADNLKVADKMYGITFANNGTNSGMHTYQVCYKNSNANTLFILNPNGTGLGSIKPNDHVNCSYDENNLKLYYTDTGRILTCKQSNNINNGNSYWQSPSGSCDLNEIKDSYSDIINKQLAYGCASSSCLKDINTIMTTGSKQIRFSNYHGDSWSKLYTSFKQSTKEGSEVSIKIDITCNSNGAWSIVPSGYVKYEYTGGVKTFTPSKYWVVGKQVTLEVWGAKGYGNRGGLGGYSKGKYTIKDINKTLYIVVGGRGKADANGYNNCKEEKSANGGGGATHISTESGTLNNKSVWNNVIIVAGGGGGSKGSKIAPTRGGNGGGLKGGGGSRGGTQTKGGIGGYGNNGRKGCGGNGGGTTNVSGGGGYYGGGNNNINSGEGGGGGGSGYIGGVTDGITENGKQSGDGMAKISW